MFVGHYAIGLAGRAKATTPRISLGLWFLAVQFLDLLWPVFLLLGWEHVRVLPDENPLLTLQFYDYPITHSLVGAAAWAALFAGIWIAQRRQRAASRTLTPRSEAPRASRVGVLLAAGVLSHWILDVVSHRPDMPVLPHGPYLGLGLWNSVPATLLVELTMFAGGVTLYLGGRAGRTRRVGVWVFIAFLVVVYFAAAFGPPPPDPVTLAWSALALWLLVPAAWFVDR